MNIYILYTNVYYRVIVSSIEFISFYLITSNIQHQHHHFLSLFIFTMCGRGDEVFLGLVSFGAGHWYLFQNLK